MSFRTSRGTQRLWLGVLATLFSAAVMIPSAVVADPVGPRPGDRHVAVMVTALLPHEHLTRRPLDGTVSERMLDLFLKTLDPMKMYFYQQDVDSFVAHEKDMVTKASTRGDITPAYDMFKIYLRRLDERVAMVDELLKIQPDFTLQEDIIIDHKAATWAKSEAEARDKWRKRVKFELLGLKYDKLEGDKSGEKRKGIDGEKAVEKLSRRYHSLTKRMHQTDAEELLEMYLNALTSSYDPHTNYMSPSSVENFDIMMRLNLEGIGAALQVVDGYTVVQKIIPGGAADKDKRLKTEDKIVGVGQTEKGEIQDVIDMKLQDVVKLIRGARGTVVRLQVIKHDNPERKVYNITREKIELKDSEARPQVFPYGAKADGTPYKLGVIKLPSFYMDMNGAKLGLPDYRSTTRDVKRILEDFNRDGVDAAILDLRNNGGGSLTEAINLTSLFTGKGPVVQVKGADGHVIPYDDADAQIVWSGPLVVVTNKFSASASEILAGAIQDYRRGLIVGDLTTHGKGTVQSLLELAPRLFGFATQSPMGSLKITVQQFYRPNGDSTQNRGVVADIELPSLTTHMDVGEADLDYPLAFDRVPAAQFRAYQSVESTAVKLLAASSQRRVAASEDFQKVERKIARYLQRKKDKKDTLNEKEFMEERAELNADKEEEKEIRDEDSTAIEKNYYLTEVMNITVDYLKMLAPAAPSNLAGPGQQTPPQRVPQ